MSRIEANKALAVEVLLGQSAFFRGLSESSRAALASISRLVRVPKGKLLFHEGDEAGAIYLVVSGAVRLHKTAESGRETVIKVVQAGEVFAEVVLFERDRYPVSAVALGAAVVLAFPRDGIHALLDQPAFRRDFLSMLMAKMRYLAERIAGLSSADAEERLLSFLRSESKGRADFEIGLSKKDVASAIDTTPETISRILKRLEARRLLSWKRNRVKLSLAVTPEGLTRIKD